jgi:hypothetical protein
MRIDELKKEIELLGDGEKWSFKAIECGDYVNIQRLIGNTRQLIAWVKIKKIFIVNTDYRTFANLPEEIREKIFDILVKFARTPVDEREEEKKYVITHKYAVSKNLNPVNLAWNKEKNAYRLINCKQDNDIYKALFTKEEIEKIKEKLDTDLTDFRIVEVE